VKCEPGCTCKRHASKGVKRDPAIGAMISASKLGHEVSPETRAKISAAFRGREWGREVVEKRAAARRKHGDQSRVDGRRSPTYRSWDGMKQRCLNPKATGYARYGGAGITVCDRWLDFANFLEDMGARPDGTTLDRIDSARGYEPGNCRWATRSEQNKNRPNFDPRKR
jgi:hypothetical protein